MRRPLLAAPLAILVLVAAGLPGSAPLARAVEADDVELHEGWNAVHWQGVPVPARWAGETLAGSLSEDVWLAVARYAGSGWLQVFRDPPLPAFDTLDEIPYDREVWIFAAAAAELTFPREPAGPPEDAAAGTVVLISNGDTFDVDLGGGDVVRVRLLGVYTARQGECFFGEAGAFLAKMLLGQTVTLERDVTDTDQEGRLLRYAYLGQTQVNYQVVRRGFGVSDLAPPDLRFAPFLEEAQALAQAEGAGRWADCLG